MNRIIAISLIAYTMLSLVLSGVVYKVTLEAELAQDRAGGEARLSDSISRLNGQLGYYQALINFVSQDPDIAAALPRLSPRDAGERLAKIALTYGISEIDEIDRSGRVIVSSIQRDAPFTHSLSIVRPAFNGRLGRENVLTPTKRAIRLSRLIGGNGSARNSAIVMSIDLSDLEFDWPVSVEPIYYRDRLGGVLSANRRALLQIGPAGRMAIEPHLGYWDRFLPDVQLWTYASGQFQMLTRPVPQLQLDAHILLDTGDAKQTARLRTMLAMATAVVLGLIGFLLLQQRRRIALESQHSATLEARVAERTSELRVAQSELVEASNLAALGRLSAGLSHELNQPLAAILNFAENGKQFLIRNKHDRAADNLGLIGDQVRRMTRIIGNLRAFAKQEASPNDPVDIVAVTRSAICIAQPDLDRLEIEVQTKLLDVPVIVSAGQVRLEQVILNLISNAQDAMVGSDLKQLTLELGVIGSTVQLRVHDTGSGLSAPERVFEPFYTTKELGASKGLGMGLALSFGIIQSFDGQLECANHANGAEFTITLPVVETK